MIKKLLSISFLAIFAVGFAACSSSVPVSQDDSLVIDKSKNYEYVIIYDKDASDTVVHQASLLCKEIKEKYNVEVHTQSDWDYTPNDSLTNQGPSKTIEILVGTTERPQSLEAYNSLEGQNAYLVSAQSNSLVIAATTDKILIDAVTEFTNRFIKPSQNSLSIPNGILLKNDSYSFFDIAKDGISSCNVVIPAKCSTRVETMATSIASKINTICGTNVKIFKDDEISSPQGCILIGAVNHPESQAITATLEPTQSLVKMAGSNIIITGYDDNSLINGIFSFLGNVILKHDITVDGSPYIYYPKTMKLSESWSHFTPSIPGGTMVESDHQSSSLLTASFNNVDLEEFDNYIELLKSLNFIVTSNKPLYNDVVLYEVNYSHIDSSVSLSASLSIRYNQKTSTCEMSISYHINPVG